MSTTKTQTTSDEQALRDAVLGTKKKSKSDESDATKSASTGNKSSEDDAHSWNRMLPCDHFMYELKQCDSWRTRIYDYYRGEQRPHECSVYKQLLHDCLESRRDGWALSRGGESLGRLQAYERDLVGKREAAARQNDVWQLREPGQAPSDWRAPLPDWAQQRLTETIWYKKKYPSQ